MMANESVVVVQFVTTTEPVTDTRFVMASQLVMVTESGIGH